MLLSLVIGSYDAHIAKESALLDQFTPDRTDNLIGIFGILLWVDAVKGNRLQGARRDDAPRERSHMASALREGG